MTFLPEGLAAAPGSRRSGEQACGVAGPSCCATCMAGLVCDLHGRPDNSCGPAPASYPSQHLLSLLSATGTRVLCCTAKKLVCVSPPYCSHSTRSQQAQIPAACCCKSWPCSPAVTQSVMQAVKGILQTGNLAVWLARDSHLPRLQRSSQIFFVKVGLILSTRALCLQAFRVVKGILNKLAPEKSDHLLVQHMLSRLCHVPADGKGVPSASRADPATSLPTSSSV